MAKPSKMRKVGSMEVIEIPGQVSGQTRGASPSQNACIVMMHGYGADARDLVSLANVMTVPQGTTWLFPNGPIQVPIGPHIYGQGWFPINIEALEKAQREGTFRDMAKETPPGMKKAREQIFGMLAEMKIPLSQVIFAGFSQGAMLATSLALFSPEPVKGLIILSGALLDEKTWADKVKNKAGLRFFQSHGVADTLLSTDGAKDLEKLLVSGGMKGKLQLFNGGHEIPQEVIHGVNQYLREIFKS